MEWEPSQKILCSSFRCDDDLTQSLGNDRDTNPNINKNPALESEPGTPDVYNAFPDFL